MRDSKKVRPVVVIIALTALIFMAPATAGGPAWQTSGPDQIRQDLYNFIENQERMLNTFEQIQAVDPHLRRSIKAQIQLVSSLSPRDLLLLGQSNLPLRQINSQLSLTVADLEWNISNSNLNFSDAADTGSSDQTGGLTNADPAPETDGAPHLGGACPASGKFEIGGISASIYPPGYCNQIDNIPVATDVNGTQEFVENEFRLSDVGYPFICPFNIPNEVIFGFETAQIIVKTINDVTDNACQQEAGGFNGSVACVVVILGLRLAEDLLEQAGECNNERRDSEGTAIYARTGEIFVQSKAHYAALEETDSLIKDAVTILNTNIGGQIFTMGNEVSDELNEGFDEIKSQVNAVELRILGNIEKVDFVGQNNEVIEYKIWCDHQRPTLRPSNCP
jgi:hypothetical protein